MTGYKDDNYTLLEVHCDLDLFLDLKIKMELNLPYIVTIDEGSSKSFSGLSKL